MTYRERREARAERLREWAEKRDEKSEQALGQARQLGAMIPFGQPVLVGHHSEGRHRRDLSRIESGYRRGFEHAEKAASMRSRADNIEAQAANAIYSDDDDAVGALEARIANLEAERDRIKAYNATCRKGSTPDESILNEKQRRDLEVCRKHQPYSVKNGRFPGYALTNLSGNINRQKKRLDLLRTR